MKDSISKLISKEKFNLQVVARLFLPSLSDADLFLHYDNDPSFREAMKKLLQASGLA